MKNIHATIFNIIPPINVSLGLTNPEEYAMAIAGVPMGRMKAKPDGTVKANVVITGFIEKSIASPIVIGIKSATTAVLLMASVK